MAASKPTDRHTHAHAQCSPASVGLAQARPNKQSYGSKVFGYYNYVTVLTMKIL